MEAARVIAERIQREGSKDVNDEIILAFRLSTGRRPHPAELSILSNLYHSQFKKYKSRPGEARKLLAVGEFKSSKPLDLTRTAALTIVASTILNYDESYTKR